MSSLNASSIRGEAHAVSGGSRCLYSAVHLTQYTLMISTYWSHFLVISIHKSSHAHLTYCIPLIGSKKLKKESLGTCLVMTLAVPLPLCFCFFLIVLTVTSLPLCQSISHLPTGEIMNNEKVWKSVEDPSQYCLRWLTAHPSQSMISGPSNENGSSASGSDFIL